MLLKLNETSSQSYDSSIEGDSFRVFQTLIQHQLMS